MSDLEKCPFCGGLVDSIVVDGIDHYVCPICGLDATFRGDQGTSKDRWSTRHERTCIPHPAFKEADR